MAELLINLKAIEQNLIFLRDLCQANEVELVGVAKGCNASAPLLELFQKCGVEKIALSRPADVLKSAKVLHHRPLYLSLPVVGQADFIQKNFYASVNSDYRVIQALAAAARHEHRVHGVILMVDIGDMREGLPPEEVVPLARAVQGLRNPFIELLGIGAMLGCGCVTKPIYGALQRLDETARDLEEHAGVKPQVVSIGGSAVLPWLEQGLLPKSINEIRFGEAILLGTIPTTGKVHPKLSQSGFVLRTTVLEVKKLRGSLLRSEVEDAFQNDSSTRCLLDVGFLDTYPQGLRAVKEGIEVVAANSDYTMASVACSGLEWKPGDCIEFLLDYQALVRALNSSNIELKVLTQKSEQKARTSSPIVADTGLHDY